jgi:glycosyltransferase involved in cell wall biosynthesis
MKKTICLNMIVKNESAVIKRCLASLRDVIDYWVILDTGSTDGTQAIIKEYLHDIPGELHERPWVNFAHNRNEALKLAHGKGDYLLFIDADEELRFLGFRQLPKECDHYYISLKTETKAWEWLRHFMVNNHLKWSWEGVIHEELKSLSTQKQTEKVLHSAYILSNPDGYRSKEGVQQKALKDADLLEEELKKNPGNPNTIYYLAQSYDVGGNFPLALKYYEERARIDKEGEGQIFASLLRMGVLQKSLNFDPAIYTNSYLQAYLYRPSRAEPLYYLANYYLETNQPGLTYLLASLALTIPIPHHDPCPLELPIYDYCLLLQVAYSAYLIKAYRHMHTACKQLLSQQNLPKEKRILVEQLLIQAKQAKE